MAEFPLPLSSPSLMGMSKGKDSKLWVLNPNPNSHLQGFIPTPTIEYKPYEVGSYFIGLDYGYYQAIRPPQPQFHPRPQPQLQPQPQPQVNMDMNMNEYVPNNDKVNVAQDQSSMFGLVRRGTGVFHPTFQPQPRSSRGGRYTQEADQRSKNASTGNGGLVMLEDCHEETLCELGLPKEWTY